MLRERRGTHFMGNRARDALFTRHVNTVCGSTHCHAARTCPATLCNAKQCILPFLNFPLRKDATCWDHQKDGLEGMLCKTPTLKKKHQSLPTWMELLWFFLWVTPRNCTQPCACMSALSPNHPLTPGQSLMRKSIPHPMVLMLRGRRVRWLAAGNPPPSKQLM